MLKLRWLIILISVALISGLAGLTAGVLLIPSSGDETRRQLSGFFEQHAYIIENLERSQQALADAFEYVRVRVVQGSDRTVATLCPHTTSSLHPGPQPRAVTTTTRPRNQRAVTHPRDSGWNTAAFARSMVTRAPQRRLVTWWLRLRSGFCTSMSNT